MPGGSVLTKEEAQEVIYFLTDGRKAQVWARMNCKFTPDPYVDMGPDDIGPLWPVCYEHTEQGTVIGASYEPPRRRNDLSQGQV